LVKARMSKRSVGVGEEQEFYVMLNLNLSGFDAGCLS